MSFPFTSSIPLIMFASKASLFIVFCHENFLYKFVKLPFFYYFFDLNIILNSVLLIISHESNQTRCHRFNK
jgi:hypothetical protein